MMRPWRCISFGALLHRLVHGKTWEGKIQLDRENSWRFLASFAYAIGQGDLFAEVLSEVPKGTHVGIYLDEKWDQVQAATTCAEKAGLASWQADLHSDHRPYTSITQSIRPHVWYLAVWNCGPDGIWARALFGRPPEVVDVKLKARFLNNRERPSHFSYSERFSSQAVAAALLLMVVASCKVVTKFARLYADVRTVHGTLLLVMLAYLCQLVYLLCHGIHLWDYSVDGNGLRVLDIAGELFHWLGTLLVSYVLIGLAYGWTLDSPMVRRVLPDSKLLVRGLAYGLGGLHLLFALLGRHYDESSAKFHRLDSWPSYVLLLVRLGMLPVFVIGAMVTLQDRGLNQRKRGFVQRFVLLGSAWFASVPVVAAIASLFAEYLRDQVVTVGMLFAQSVGVVILAWLFLTRKEYSSMSSLASGALLPTVSGRGQGQKAY